MANKYQQVADLLRGTAKQIKEILSDRDDEMHAIRLGNDLERSATYITLITGSGDAPGSEVPKLGPAKTIGGVPIKKVRRFTEDDMVPSDDKIHQLKKQVESAIEYFRADRTPESLIAQIPDQVIRGVAKKVGLPYSSKEVAVLTPEFVGQVQAKVREMFPNEPVKDDRKGSHQIPGVEPFHTPIPPKAGEGGVSEVVNVDIEAIENFNPENEAKVVQMPASENTDDEKKKAISLLQDSVDMTRADIEVLNKNLANEPNKNKRTAIRKKIAAAEEKLASLTKQLEDANKD